MHQLRPGDAGNRLTFCHWFKSFLQRNGNSILDKTFFSDEVWFHLTGYVNKQNNRIWSSDNPHMTHEMPLHDQKLGVWVAMSRKRIIVLFFNEIVNGDIYRNQLLKPFFKKLTSDEKDTGWFQQDGATCHTANLTKEVLKEVFDTRLISKPKWPARSPDLTPPDFFLWGMLKGRVYEKNPPDLSALKLKIKREIAKITEAQLNDVFENLKKTRANV